MTTKLARPANDNGATSHDLPDMLRPFIDLLARQAVREYMAANDNDAAGVNATTAR